MNQQLLIVDDEAVLLRVLGSYFAARGYTVDCATERRQAEAFLSNASYACVVTDLNLSGGDPMGGLELLTHVRDRYPQTRVVILTAHGRSDVQQRAHVIGVDAFLRKPVALPELARIVASCLATGTPGQPSHDATTGDVLVAATTAGPFEN